MTRLIHFKQNLFPNKYNFTGCILLLIVFSFQCNTKDKNGKSRSIKDFISGIDYSISAMIQKEGDRKFDSTKTEGFFTQYPKLQEIEPEWKDFYSKRNYAFAWVDKNGLSPGSLILFNRLNTLHAESVARPIPYIEELDKLYESATNAAEKEPDAKTLVDAEMMLSAQFFLFAKQMYNALSPDDRKELGWNISDKKDISYPAYLQKLMNASTEDFSANEEVYAQYGLLKNYLAKYKKIAASGGWDTIANYSKVLKLKDSSDIVKNIKLRLVKSGDISLTDTTGKYDEKLATAVRKFRKRHGLSDTNFVDKYMIAEMNVLVEKRIQQIQVNMERTKWMPHNPGPNYLFVNIPDFNLVVFENNKPIFKMPVVVGQAGNKTVIFSDTLTLVAFSPYWNVPYSIYKNELANKSAAYLRRNGMQRTGKNQIRQLPGPKNSLGKVKFLFPNGYNIYFHDTPAKYKFQYNQRAFSHGCIRLSDPKKLAQYVLRKEPEYTEVVIDSLMNQSKEVQVKLKQPIPVFISYFTAFVDAKTGDLEFRKDIYKHDEQLLDYFSKKQNGVAIVKKD